MKLILLLALALVGGPDGANSDPCRSWNPNGYDIFSHRHVICGTVPNTDKEWETYLEKHKLCRSVVKQSFIEEKTLAAVKAICNGGGVRFRQDGGYANDLCISQSKIFIHDVTVKRNTCQVSKVARRRRFVIVACQKANNRCLPTHFHGSWKYPQGGQAPVCQP